VSWLAIGSCDVLTGEQREVRQQRADIDSVYELLDEVRGTVADLDAKVDAGFAAVTAKIDAGFAEILSRLDRP
jgi:hypothetical protein